MQWNIAKQHAAARGIVTSSSKSITLDLTHLKIYSGTGSDPGFAVSAGKGFQGHVCNTLGNEQTAVSSALKLKLSLRRAQIVPV